MLTPTSSAMTQATRTLYLQWVLATIVGWAIGFYVCEAIEHFISTVFVDGLVLGAGLGLAQGIVLRGRIAHPGWWAGATFLGFGVAKGVAAVLVNGQSAAVTAAMTAVLIGIALGLAQWLVLGIRRPGAAWWLPATIAAWAIGWTIIGLVQSAGWPTITVYLGGGAGAAAAGLITGTALVWLVRPGRPSSSIG
jgi:hypothetical protein